MLMNNEFDKLLKRGSNLPNIDTIRDTLKVADCGQIRGIKSETLTSIVTWPLKLEKLFEVHEKIHSDELSLNRYDMDKEMPTWGNYVTGLLQHFACRKTE
jgi:hypothetical protein